MVISRCFVILLTHQKQYCKFPNPNPISSVCISVRLSLAADDLYRGDCCLLQSNSHPKWLGRRVVQREIMCLLWTLMIQWKQTNDPPRVSRRVQQLHHSNSVKTWKKTLMGFLFYGEGGGGGLRKKRWKSRQLFCKTMQGGGIGEEMQKEWDGRKNFGGQSWKDNKNNNNCLHAFYWCPGGVGTW